MKIAFCLITKGDEHLKDLKRLIKSAKPAIDTVHITANHKPYMKLKKWCEDKGYDFTYLKWQDDFSHQRNYNFSQAPEGTNYILWADHDDVIVNAHLIRRAARIADKSDYDAVFFTYWYASEFNGKPSLDTFVRPELVQMRERLMRPGKFVWRKRIHETPVPLDGENYRYTKVKYSDDDPVAWLHLGAERNISVEKLMERNERNRKLLEAELKDERANGQADPRTLLYLMKVYADTNDEGLLKECMEMGREYMEKSGWDEERAVCCKLMATCMGKLGAHDEARDFLHNAIKEYPHNPLLYLHLARAYFNLENYSAMKHWMQIGQNMDLEENHYSMNNILEMKALSAELMLKHYLYGEKKIREAWRSARLLNKIDPSEDHQLLENHLYEQKQADIASEHIHEIFKYYEELKIEEYIPKLYESLPDGIQKLPFAVKYYNHYRKPRIWKDNEIAYFADFGKGHFHKWDGNSLKTGIGGSETAVIRLSEEWTKMGYKVTVYCDPEKKITVNGVLYLPFYYFNSRDKFNILIQWRHNALAGKVSAKKFIVDLHDVTHSATYISKIDKIDKIMVKSKYHRDLLEEVPDNKFLIISNGIW